MDQPVLIHRRLRRVLRPALHRTQKRRTHREVTQRQRALSPQPPTHPPSRARSLHGASGPERASAASRDNGRVLLAQGRAAQRLGTFRRTPSAVLRFIVAALEQIAAVRVAPAPRPSAGQKDSQARTTALEARGSLRRDEV